MNALETRLENTHNLSRCADRELTAECEDACTSEAIAEARRVHLAKLTKVKDAVIKVVPRTDATTRPFTGRWMDTMRDDEARKARWTTPAHEQTLNGNEDFFSATPAMMHLKMMLVEAALKGHVAAIGDCSGVFYWSPLNQTEQKAKFGSSRFQRQSWDQTTSGKPCQHSQVSREHRERGTRTVRTFSRVPWRLEQSRYDRCLFCGLEPAREHIEEKAGRHVDDFLVTGSEPNAELSLAQA